MLNLTRQSELASDPPNCAAEFNKFPIILPPAGRLTLRILLSRLAGLAKLLSAELSCIPMLDDEPSCPNAATASDPADWALLTIVPTLAPTSKAAI